MRGQVSSGWDLGTCPAGGTGVAPGRCRVAQMFLLGLGTGSDAEDTLLSESAGWGERRFPPIAFGK